MLISYERLFLFIHVPKTAGCSILDALAPFCPPPQPALWRRRLTWLGPVNRYGHLYRAIQFPVHVTAATVQRCLPPAIFERLYKFAFIRNPWDAMVSQYMYIRQTSHHHRHQLVAKMSGFEQFLHWDLSRHNRNQHQFLYDRRRRCLVNFIGRFESLVADFNRVSQHLGLDIRLPHENKSDHRDYREYYTPQTRQLVADHFARDIELFGYNFDNTRTTTSSGSSRSTACA